MPLFNNPSVFTAIIRRFFSIHLPFFFVLIAYRQLWRTEVMAVNSVSLANPVNTSSQDTMQQGSSITQSNSNEKFKIYLTIKDKVLITHTELTLLCRCAQLLRSKPQGMLYISASSSKKHLDYIRKTLIHFGVSCGQINITIDKQSHSLQQGIWLKVV